MWSVRVHFGGGQRRLCEVDLLAGVMIFGDHWKRRELVESNSEIWTKTSGQMAVSVWKE